MTEYVLHRPDAWTEQAIVERVASEQGVSTTESQVWFENMLMYLSLRDSACPYSEPIAPSPIVDEPWHTFILFTREYAAYCDELAGRMIHHAPVVRSDDGDPVVYARTRAELAERFGVLDPKIWPAAWDFASLRRRFESDGECRVDEFWDAEEWPEVVAALDRSDLSPRIVRNKGLALLNQIFDTPLVPADDGPVVLAASADPRCSRAATLSATPPSTGSSVLAHYAKLFEA